MKTKSLMLAALSTLLLGLLPNIAKAATMTQASTSVDLAAQTVSFQIVWNSSPDFLSVDSVGRPADQFRYWIMPTDLSYPPFSSYLAVALNNSDRFIDERVGTLSVTLPFGPTLAVLPFTLNDTVLDFVASFSNLNKPDGAFVYLLESFNFGGTNRVAFFGTSNGSPVQVDPFSVIPLPATLPLFAGGLLLLGWAARRRKSTQPPQAIG
jgi:hypothetical protein